MLKNQSITTFLRADRITNRILYYFYSNEMDSNTYVNLFDGTFKYALCRYGSKQRYA